MNERDSLKSLLHEWKAPESTDALDARVYAAYGSRRPGLVWHLWWTRTTKALSLAAVIALPLVVSLRVNTWVNPQQPAVPARPAAVGFVTRIEMSGYQPLPDGQIRLIRSRGDQ